ncbi:MAG: lipoprotein [Serratia inhibens]|uniref:LPS translocon maturation chaperone LptM n=1 Tax=Serratia inhibens TaxID=2338073 RepID=UPI003C7CB167
MKKQLRYALMAVLLAGLSGCGLKGPLYFPSDEPGTKKPATQVQTGDQVQKNQQETSVSQQKPSMSDQ